MSCEFRRLLDVAELVKTRKRSAKILERVFDILSAKKNAFALETGRIGSDGKKNRKAAAKP